MITWENAIEDCIRTLDDPRDSSDEKGKARLRLRKLARHIDRLEGDGWDGLEGDIRNDFFPDEN